MSGRKEGIMPGRKVIDLDLEKALREGEANALGEHDRPHGFHLTTPEGRTVHVTGDPRMGDDDAELIGKMLDLAYEQAMRERIDAPLPAPSAE
jgi:hypothetical protein